MLNGAFVPLVPSPVAFFLGVNQTGFLQDGHVMRDGRLREVDALFNVAGAHADLFPEGAGIPDFERLQDFATRGIGDGMEQALESLILGGHGLEIE